MQEEPLVCAVCLTRNRPEMTARAIKCFEAQTYTRKRMLVWDTSEDYQGAAYENDEGTVACVPAYQQTTIGALRNSANGFWNDFDIICHFDSDDWSHPMRIAEQVALLQASGKEAVGYREMLFWRAQSAMHPEEVAAGLTGQAWLYTHGKPSYCLGGSLAYFRSTWERKPFPDRMEGEDTEWLKGLNSLGVSSIEGSSPRMVCAIHGRNVSRAYGYLEACQAQGEKWRRMPTWDAKLRETITADKKP